MPALPADLKGGVRPSVLALVTEAHGGSGGIAQYNRDFLDAVSECSRHLSVLSLSNIDAAGSDPNTSRMGFAGSRWRFVAAALTSAWRDRPDIVFCGHINFSLLGWATSKLARARFWLQVHGIDAWAEPTRARRFGVVHADLITAVSRFTRKGLLDWSLLSPSRVRVLPNTVSERFSVALENEPPTPDVGALKRAGPTLLTVARLSTGDRYKGIEEVLEALQSLRKRHPSIAYLIAGDGDDRVRLVRRAHELGVGELVNFLGRVDDAALPDLYRSADLFVMPSRGEGFGIVFIEAAASGTMSMGRDEDGSVDALQDGALGFVASQGELAPQIERALATPARPRERSAATYATFGRSHYKSHVAKLIDQLVVTGFRESTSR